MDAYSVILLTTELFLYLFHLSMIVLLFQKRHSIFKGPFYNIFRIVIVADFLNFLVVVTVTKLPSIPNLSKFYENTILFPTILQNFSAYIAYLQFFGHTFMALNRFTFIFFPLMYATIWQRHWYTFLLIFLPLLCNCWKLHEPAIFIEISDKSISLRIMNPEIFQIHFAVSTTVYVITTCFVAVFNLLSFLKFYLYKKNASSLHINEKNLLIVSFIVFLAQVFRTCYNLLRLFFATNDAVMLIATILLPIISDIFCLCGSVSLLILSKSTRKVYKSFYFGGNCFLHSTKTVAPLSYQNHIIPVSAN